MGANNSCEISRLPQDCLSDIISLTLTSPEEACRCSTVCTFFRSVADADAVWEHFFPSDIDHILSNAVDHPVCTSKKELYYHLSNRGILVDDGKMCLKLDRSTGAKIYVLSATRAVTIEWSKDVQYWQRVPNHESRFSEVQHLVKIWSLDISANFRCNNLTPQTRYGAYFIFKLEKSRGLDVPLEATIAFHDEESHNRICVEARNDGEEDDIPNNQIRYPQVRDDQWCEVEIGEFYNDGEEDDEVGVRVHQYKGSWTKRGLIFNSIEFRPKIY